VLERAYYLWRSRDDMSSLRDEFLKLLGKGDIDGAKKRLASSQAFEARIVHAGIENAAQGPEAVQERLDSESQLARLQMERNLAFLGTVGNNAPFVGLLGTVIGVIRSFQALNESAGKVTEGLMSEIGEALVATAIGILVALPAVAFFNFFSRVIKGRLMRAEALGGDLLAHLKASPEASDAEAEAAE
jgi:biopolymer transport protein ExbB